MQSMAISALHGLERSVTFAISKLNRPGYYLQKLAGMINYLHFLLQWKGGRCLEFLPAMIRMGAGAMKAVAGVILVAVWALVTGVAAQPGQAPGASPDWMTGTAVTSLS